MKNLDQQKRKKEGYYDEATGIHHLPENWWLEPEEIEFEKQIREQFKKEKMISIREYIFPKNNKDSIR